ncbi:hypothetical protein B0H21DRAFT_165291 [Amylocystis lapponica]|nr:hypothetical protein B0H21DRAFT_165291 [Amylocystis lapponica]
MADNQSEVPQAEFLPPLHESKHVTGTRRDEAMANLPQSTHHIHRPQSPSAPVNRLPNELLVKIFRQLLYVHPGSARLIDPYMGWLVYTRVCQYWRAVALATPNFWAEIDLSKGDRFVQMCLARSGDAVLDIYHPHYVATKGETRAMPFPQIMAIILPHTARIRSLRLIGGALDYQPSTWLLRLPPSIMPRLEVLELCKTFDKSHHHFVCPTMQQLPVLRSLSLSWIVVGADSLLFTNLVTLDLQSVRGFGASMESCLCVLAGCRGLRHLAIKDSLYKFSEQKTTTYPEPTHFISLPALQKLDLRDTAINVAYFLAHLIISADTLVSISCTHKWNDGLSTFTAVLPRDTSRVVFPVRIQSLYLARTDNALMIRAYHHDHSAALIDESSRGAFDKPSDAEPVNLDITIKYAHSDVPPLAPEMYQATSVFSSAPITALKVCADFTSLTAHCWRNMFLSFPCLGVIYLEEVVEDGFQVFLEVLKQYPICPRLRVLAFRCRFMFIYRITIKITVAKLLAHCLEARVANGAPRLQELRLIGDWEADPQVPGVYDRLKTLADKFVRS